MKRNWQALLFLCLLMIGLSVCVNSAYSQQGLWLDNEDTGKVLQAYEENPILKDELATLKEQGEEKDEKIKLLEQKVDLLNERIALKDEAIKLRDDHIKFKDDMVKDYKELLKVKEAEVKRANLLA